MRSFLSVSMLILCLCTTASMAVADEPRINDVQAELAKWQGLWQTSPGGMEHEDGKQVVRNPVIDGVCFFVRGDRIIWLDKEGKPTGLEEIITLNPKTEPKQVTFTPKSVQLSKDKDRNEMKPSHGIYVTNGSSLTIHIGLLNGPAPKRFLVLNSPEKGVDGKEWLVHRKKLYGN